MYFSQNCCQCCGMMDFYAFLEVFNGSLMESIVPSYSSLLISFPIIYLLKRAILVLIGSDGL